MAWYLFWKLCYVYSRGAWSLANTILYCEAFSTCYYYCYGESCPSTTIICDTTATCNVTCYSTDICPEPTETSLSDFTLKHNTIFFFLGDVP